MSHSVEADHVKVLFRISNDDGTEEVESVWALPADRGYRLDNIPFYARSVAYGDIVAAEKGEDGALEFMSLVEESGHSTIRLWFERAEDVQGVRESLRAMGCPSELDLSRLVAVDVPPNVPYSAVRKFLDAGEAGGMFEYEEGCLGQTQ